MLVSFRVAWSTAEASGGKRHRPPSVTSLRETMPTTRRAASALSLGSPATFTTAVTRMTNVMATEKCSGLMVPATKASGSVAFSTESAWWVSRTAESKKVTLRIMSINNPLVIQSKQVLLRHSLCFYSRMEFHKIRGATSKNMQTLHCKVTETPHQSLNLMRKIWIWVLTINREHQTSLSFKGKTKTSAN